jgi:hypothetical protein
MLPNRGSQYSRDEGSLPRLNKIKVANFLDYDEARALFEPIHHAEDFSLLLRQAAYFGNINYMKFLEAQVRIIYGWSQCGARFVSVF